MKIRLDELVLRFRRDTVAIQFVDFNYFYGQMGAGKSSIARLIDFCFGGTLVETRAIQNEFTWASLVLTINGRPLTITRDYHSDQIRAQWEDGENRIEIVVPARVASGEVVPGTGVETLSDLVFYLSGIVPPRIYRGRSKDESQLVRLSLRDLLWYCYLDQDSIDSDFFHLDDDANAPVRSKSRAVLRYVLGYHQERVAELEAQLDEVRRERLEAAAGYEAIRKLLADSDLPSDLQLAEQRRQLQAKEQELQTKAEGIRTNLEAMRDNAIEHVRNRARQLAEELADYRNAVDELRDQMAKDKAHRNELLSLGTRFRRTQSARAILRGVAFTDCPRCKQTLPARDSEHCPLCGLPETSLEADSEAEKVAEADLSARTKELDSLIEAQTAELRSQERLVDRITNERAVAEIELSEMSRRYDSAYLSQALAFEKDVAVVREQLRDLERYERLLKRVDELQSRATELGKKETQINEQLAAARALAERDTTNLRRLKELFLDCLVRAKTPGILPTDVVEIASPYFLPEVFPSQGGELTSTSFANLGSGGKKTLFKACFAVAIHRLAEEIGANLPSILIIDSPMKNISERINRKQFEGFHAMLYDLAQTELRETQIVLIDKELLSPPEGFPPKFSARYMTPDDDKHPPLIPYYRGK